MINPIDNGDVQEDDASYHFASIVLDCLETHDTDLFCSVSSKSPVFQSYRMIVKELSDIKVHNIHPIQLQNAIFQTLSQISKIYHYMAMCLSRKRFIIKIRCPSEMRTECSKKCGH
ncbi:hypothetical protein NPIL_39411 [Nephila pilipes]|uniref:Uncharacterized protein n=1 Tax=Nephila pilipes TaxID=299642 RepID=A0A8X6PAH4_NEPPI|nr:hypothetical protein NPIL_39411 [Nephila pilipes]